MATSISRSAPAAKAEEVGAVASGAEDNPVIVGYAVVGGGPVIPVGTFGQPGYAAEESAAAQAAAEDSSVLA